MKVTRPVYLTLIAAYVLLSALFGSSQYAPVFLKSWRLFDWWVPIHHEYQDIRFKRNGEGESYHYALRSAPYLQSVGVDTVTLANLLLKRFDYRDYNLDQAIQKFKAQCDCRDVELVRLKGATSEHILFDRRAQEEVVRAL